MVKRKTTRPTLVAPRRGGSGADASAKKGPAKRAAKRAAKRSTRRKVGLFSFLWRLPVWLVWRLGRLVFALAWRGALLGGVVVLGGAAYFASSLPPVEQMVDGRARGSVTMFDRHGDIFAWRGEQFGEIVRPESVSPDLINAIIASEDRRFFWHFGLSPRGIASAMLINLREGRSPLSGHGGSTLTQQTAKLVCLGVPFDPQVWKSEADYELDCRRTTLWRKAKEAVYAVALELRYTKQEILTIYLNRAFLGAGSRGFEAASQRYFGKSSNRLSTAEAAMLAGLLPAPSRYAPTNNLKRSQDRAATVLRVMEEQGYIEPQERAAAVNSPATLSAQSASLSGGYFADWVMARGPDFFTQSTTEDVLIRTTFDPRIQSAIEDAVEQVFENRVRGDSKAEAAVVVMDKTGAVRAMLGGRALNVRGVFNRATQARRQTGSVFKAFVYAAALDHGINPQDTILDEPFCVDVPGSRRWCPKNYKEEYFGEVSITEAFARSLNMPAVRVSQAVGLEAISDVARGLGVGEELAQGPALALGASEATLLDMVGAYGGILDGGRAVVPYGLLDLRLREDDAALMGITGGIGQRVISQPAASAVTWMMYQTVQSGTGQRAKIDGWEIAGKTGTTQNARDAWFIGFTADHVIGVWMGYDDNTPLTGVTGGGLPADIWREAVERIVAQQVPQPLPMTRGGQMPPMAPRSGLSADDMSSGSGTVRDRAIQDAIRDFIDGLVGSN